MIIFQQVGVYFNEPIKIDELIKLAKQAIQKRPSDRIGKDNINSYFWQQKEVVHLKHRNRKRNEKCCVVIFKKDIWKKKLLQKTLQNILENQAIQRTVNWEQS